MGQQDLCFLLLEPGNYFIENTKQIIRATFYNGIKKKSYAGYTTI